jgi:hypothetical protein
MKMIEIPSGMMIGIGIVFMIAGLRGAILEERWRRLKRERDDALDKLDKLRKQFHGCVKMVHSRLEPKESE